MSVRNEEQMKELFAKFSEDGEAHQFDRVEPKLSRFREIHALLLIDQIMTEKFASTQGSFAFGHASHDTVWLSIEPSQLAECATEQDILTLVRCGIVFDAHQDAFLFYP